MLSRFKQEVTQYVRENLTLILYSALGTAILASIFVNSDSANAAHYLQSLFYAFALGISLCLGADYIYEEKPQLKKWHPLFLAGLFAIGFAIAHYLQDWPVFQVHIILTSYFVFLLTPSSVRKEQKVAFHWFIFILYALGLSYFISGLLLALLAILSWVVKELFSFELPKISQKIGLASLAIFLPVNLFAFFKPAASKVNSLRYSLPNALEKPVRLIFLPVLIIYVAVLLAYSVKILFTMSLPRGMVSIPITIAYLLFYSLNAYWESQNKENEGLWKYRNWLQASFIPLLVMMGIGVVTRIYQYGFTQDRVYLVIVYAIMLISLGLRFIYKKLELRKLIVIVTGILILTSAGPLSAPTLSYKSQINRFLETASKYNREYKSLNDFKLEAWTVEDISTASTALNVITSYKATKHLSQKATEKSLFAADSIDLAALKERLNRLESSKYFFEKKIADTCKTLTSKILDRDAIEVRGFDWVHPVNTYTSTGDKDKFIKVDLTDKKIPLHINLDDYTIQISQEGKLETLLTFKETLFEQVKKLNDASAEQPLILKTTSKNLQIEIRIKYIRFDCEPKNLRADILVKEL